MHPGQKSCVELKELDTNGKKIKSKQYNQDRKQNYFHERPEGQIELCRSDSRLLTGMSEIWFSMKVP